MLIGLSGRAGSGKDTAASVLVSEGGFRLVRLAGALKDMLRSLLAYQGVGDELREALVEGYLKEVPSTYLSGRSPRYAMQTLGTQWGRQLIDEDFWTTASRNRIANLLAEGIDVVVPDVRVPSEVGMIRSMGGKVFRVARMEASDKAVEHESEILPPYDVEIRNDGSQAAFEQKVRYLILGAQRAARFDDDA